MALERRSYTPAEEIALTTQVEGCCPLCGTACFTKKGHTYRYYELAHNYPLNPKPAEAEELEAVELLSADRNDLDNQFRYALDVTRDSISSAPVQSTKSFSGSSAA